MRLMRQCVSILFALSVTACSLFPPAPPSPPTPPVDPPPVVTPPVDPPPVVTPPPAARRPLPDEARAYRGFLTGLRDSAGRHVWTPALPGAPDAVRREWLDLLAAAGATHVPIGPFDGGPAYPGVEWSNPDWSRDVGSIRSLVLDILTTRSVRGHGLVPVLFLDGGGRDPRPRLDVVLPTAAEAIRGEESSIVSVPCGWESQEWLPRECYDAAWAWFAKMPPEHVIAWHSWPSRSNGASNSPNDPNNTDPWLGPPNEAGQRFGAWDLFWSPKLSPFSMFLYQSDAIRDRDAATCGGLRSGASGSDALRNVWIRDERTGREGWAFKEDCWMNRTSDAIARIGGGVCSGPFGEGGSCGPGRKTFVVFETHAYYEWRATSDRPWDPALSRLIADLAQSECRKYGVECGFGNSFPSDW